MSKYPALMGRRLPSIFDTPILDRFMSDFQEFKVTKFPPANVRLLRPEAEDKEPFYRIEMAVAGYSKDDLTISVDGSIVIVSGEMTSKSKDDDIVSSELMLGQIAKRNFSRGFTFGSVPIEVENAECNDGILTFDVRVVKPPKGNTVTIK